MCELACSRSRFGMDRSAVSNLEIGQGANPTVDADVRYAEGVGKRLVVSVMDV
jgi:transcriptional regulator with XRE-family HTH domain